MAKKKGILEFFSFQEQLLNCSSILSANTNEISYLLTAYSTLGAGHKDFAYFMPFYPHENSLRKVKIQVIFFIEL